MSSGSKARHHMYIFVAIILAAALAIAGAYVVIAKPGEAAEEPVSEVVNPNS